MSDFWRRLARNRGAVIGLALLALVVLVAVLAPLLYQQSPWRMVQRPFLPPMALDGFWFGTDTLGRDIGAGLAHGARVSLLIGLVSTVVALAIGIPLGAVAGYFGGRWDDALMRFTEFFQTIPSFALAIVIVAILEPSLSSIVLAIALVSWPPVARLVRGEFLSLRSREYVQAAILSGLSPVAIIFRQILPNSLSPIIVLASLMVASAILLESALSFLGLGAQPPAADWGTMVSDGRVVLKKAPHATIFPGVMIVLVALAFNFVGDGLRDALDPKAGARRSSG